MTSTSGPGTTAGSQRRLFAAMAGAGIALTATTATAGPARAADPPDSWANLRVLNCDGDQVTTYLTPAGFGTPFHVVGSTDVITPKHVEVIFPGTDTAVTTYDVPGFSRNDVRTVHCTYTDPAGLFVMVDGLRT